MKELCREQGRVSLKPVNRNCTAMCGLSMQRIGNSLSVSVCSLRVSLQTAFSKRLKQTLYIFSYYSIYQALSVSRVLKKCFCICVHLLVKGVSFSLELGCFVFVLHLLSLFEHLLKSSQLLLQGLDLLSFKHDVLHLPCTLHTYTTIIRYEILDRDRVIHSRAGNRCFSL